MKRGRPSAARHDVSAAKSACDRFAAENEGEGYYPIRIWVSGGAVTSRPLSSNDHTSYTPAFGSKVPNLFMFLNAADAPS